MIGGVGRGTSLKKPRKATNQATRYPAPLGGMDSRQAIGSENLNHSIYSYNLVPYEFGLIVRHGFRERDRKSVV